MKDLNEKVERDLFEEFSNISELLSIKLESYDFLRSEISLDEDDHNMVQNILYISELIICLYSAFVRLADNGVDPCPVFLESFLSSLDFIEQEVEKIVPKKYLEKLLDSKGKNRILRLLGKIKKYVKRRCST